MLVIGVTTELMFPTHQLRNAQSIDIAKQELSSHLSAQTTVSLKLQEPHHLMNAKSVRVVDITTVFQSMCVPRATSAPGIPTTTGGNLMRNGTSQ